jgi:hypothetical protein
MRYPVPLRLSFDDEAVGRVFAAYPADLRERLLDLRELVFSTAEETDGVGWIVECLKWGQPAYLTEQPRSGSTIRIDGLKGQSRRYGLFVHCQTSLVPMFRNHYDGQLSFAGNRGIVLSLDEPLPIEPLKHCIALALTYHLKRIRR